MHVATSFYCVVLWKVCFSTSETISFGQLLLLFVVFSFYLFMFTFEKYGAELQLKKLWNINICRNNEKLRIDCMLSTVCMNKVITSSSCYD